jgi:hypothetical protein
MVPERLEPEDWSAPQTRGYDYGEGSDITNCRSCGALVRWATNSETHKKMPVDPDGISHFASCPDADRWRKK